CKHCRRYRFRYGVLFFFFQAEDGIRDDLVTGSDVCSSDLGDTIRLAVAAAVNAGAADVRTAVAFKTGEFKPDFHALATESTIIQIGRASCRERGSSRSGEAAVG